MFSNKFLCRMTARTKDDLIDKFIIILFFASITMLLYFSSLAQSEGGTSMAAPMYILLLPLGVAVLQFLRVCMFLRTKMSGLSKTWLFILFYYILAFVIGFFDGQKVLDYYIVWFVLCPPAAWLYFPTIVKVNPSTRDLLVNWSFWVLVLFSGISLYFIPRSIRSNGLFSSLNTGYYVLFIYPLVMLNSNKMKKIIATTLMIVVVILSMKRGGYVVVALAFSLYLLFVKKTSLIKKIIIVAICLSALAYAIPKLDEMTNGTLTTRYEFSQNGGDHEGRSTMYPIVWKSIWNSDAFELVFGHGPNAVINNGVLNGDAAHNDYLEFLYDFGIIGLILLILYQWQLILITIQSYKNKEYFFPTIFAFSTIMVLSMVSIVYAFYYFLLIIPFWGIVCQSQVKR